MAATGGNEDENESVWYSVWYLEVDEPKKNACLFASHKRDKSIQFVVDRVIEELGVAIKNHRDELDTLTLNDPGDRRAPLVSLLKHHIDTLVYLCCPYELEQKLQVITFFTQTWGVLYIIAECPNNLLSSYHTWTALNRSK